jgi:hypothetical protein
MATCIGEWVHGFFTALKASGHIPTDTTPREDWPVEATISSVLCTQGLLVLTCTAGETFKLSPEGRKMPWESRFTFKVTPRVGCTLKPATTVPVCGLHNQLTSDREPWHALGVQGTACIGRTPLEWWLCCGKARIPMDADDVRMDSRKKRVADSKGNVRRIGSYEGQVRVLDPRGMPRGPSLARNDRVCRVQRDLLDRSTPLGRLRRLLDEGGPAKSRKAMELVAETLDRIDDLVERLSAWSACSSDFKAHLEALTKAARFEIEGLVNARHEPARRFLQATEAAIAALSRKRKRS